MPCEAGDPGPRVAAPYWRQSSSSGFASQGEGKGQPEVKAMPKPKKMPRDAQLPPLKRMRLTPREPETPPPGHEETEVVLVDPRPSPSAWCRDSPAEHPS